MRTIEEIKKCYDEAWEQYWKLKEDLSLNLKRQKDWAWLERMGKKVQEPTSSISWDRLQQEYKGLLAMKKSLQASLETLGWVLEDQDKLDKMYQEWQDEFEVRNPDGKYGPDTFPAWVQKKSKDEVRRIVEAR